ncbi:DUF7487 domain-containing protein [Paenibacillus cremeus]|uniref:DUF7487 domain-containing protein n=1 Tax=Paenibacillus cremeus TaxID=2163881 RepID=A0A559KCV3_9BACL|nr:hypothetical protein [Paenibacillus cremeus]TVY09955.1 hypothetical protein FPZ49_11330 [Paenibacillus cremeus]
MIILPQMVKVKWHNFNREWYESKGYVYTGHLKEFEVPVYDLIEGSHQKVRIKCDYCDKEFSRTFKDHNLIRKNSVIDKDACFKCGNIKSMESSQLLYGVNSAAQLPKAKEKRKRTCLKKYGTESPLSNETVRNKINNTVIELYGVSNQFQREEVKEKSKQTLLKNYGATNLMQIPEHLEIALSKRAQTLYKNGDVSTSRQQIYIWNVLGGELNYPVDRINLDIGFLLDKIYLEYQGSGHDLSVKMNKISKEEQKEIDKKRYYYLKNRGWKMIEIISTSQYDYLPNEEVLISMFEYSKEHLKEHSWITFDIDKLTVRTSIFEIPYNFGKLLNTRQYACNI